MGIPIVARWRTKMHRWALVAKQNTRIHVVGECGMYKEEWDVLREEMRKIGERNMKKKKRISENIIASKQSPI